VAPDWSVDLGIAPEAAAARLSAAINKRKKRAFGVLKTENEYVGFVGDPEFEIWERQKRAIHAVGQIRGRRGGTHIDVSFVIPLRTRILIVVFFVLYALAALGIALQPPQADVSLAELAVAGVGAVVLAVIFGIAALGQRADLRAFIERTYAEVSRI
jgi:hypothetical protein